MKLRTKRKQLAMPVVVTNEELEEAYRLNQQSDVARGACSDFARRWRLLDQLAEDIAAELVTITPENYSGG